MNTIFVKHKTKMSTLKQFFNNFGLLSKMSWSFNNIVDTRHLYSLFPFSIIF